MRKSEKHPRLAKKLKGLVIIVAIIFAGVALSNNLKPVIQTISANQAKILCTAAVNNAVVSELQKLSVDYDELVNVLRDEAGNITAIETNAVEINRLKAILTEAVNARLSAIPDQNVSIPLGTLTGLELLSGRGPLVRLRMLPSSFVESALVNHFETAGINQTQHQIMIEFTVTMTAILSPYATTVDVVTNVCIAETIIIGTVPNTYATF